MLKRTARDLASGLYCISYKCEGCGQRVRVTPIQAQHFHGAFTAYSRICVLKACDLRTQQWRLLMGVPGPSEGAALGEVSCDAQSHSSSPVPGEFL